MNDEPLFFFPKIFFPDSQLLFGTLFYNFLLIIIDVDLTPSLFARIFSSVTSTSASLIGEPSCDSIIIISINSIGNLRREQLFENFKICFWNFTFFETNNWVGRSTNFMSNGILSHLLTKYVLK